MKTKLFKQFIVGLIILSQTLGITSCKKGSNTTQNESPSPIIVETTDVKTDTEVDTETNTEEITTWGPVTPELTESPVETRKQLTHQLLRKVRW